MSAGAAKRCEKREYLKAERKLKARIPESGTEAAEQRRAAGDLFRSPQRYEREAARKCCESANTK